MSRYLIHLNSSADRARAMRVVAAAPAGTRVEVKAVKRSLPQNAFLWSALSDVALQKTHCGRKYTPEIWKTLFMHACGQEVQFIPSLDQTTLVPWGHRSSDLSKPEMSTLIDFIIAWCAQNGVTLHDEQRGSMILDDKAQELHLKILAMWQTGLDTVDMSRALLMTEAAAERALHAMLETRRAVKLADAK